MLVQSGSYAREWRPRTALSVQNKRELVTMERPKARALLMAIAVVLCGHGAAAQTSSDAPVAEPPRAVELEALTEHATQLLQQRYGYCITNREREGVDEIFGIRNSDMNLFLDCDDMTAGTMMERVCVLSELRLYFENLATVDTPPPNLNCNASGWDQACEAGWAGRVEQPVKLDSEIVPSRLLAPLPCCDGFFCPRGLSCMIPCPSGSYCPSATLNHDTNMCEPYGYQVMQNSSMYAAQCGGADKWADVSSTNGIFCPAGHFCPSPVRSRNCTVGHFCRLGSTAQEKCSRLTACESGNLQSQNLQGVGGLILAGLLILLVVVYTCSDWLVDLRSRRKAFARELAARQAHEHISKYERLKRQASRLLSRGRSRKQPAEPISMEEELQSLSPQNGGSSRRTNSGLSQHSGTIDEVGSGRLPTVEIPTKDSHSQVFAYAYGQIAKERVQQASVVGKKRFEIEVAFEDLSMVLKHGGSSSSRKQILISHVTGKLSPGKITAIMGPSGAGKTTFLNGLAGKATHTRITGRVIINGKLGSMHSYKRVIGFVPQDDIVHGTLTVEENLWFSASYRLPVQMPRYERVLVVERTIQALGLGGIRDALVGTVEDRGISGGQRKRVNVGLELVIEPSLLILDEPTSGLDSTSSRLVLQALRREAVEGVNVILVLHQPSYGLFKMFDDVMFLAKGGYTVYSGPVSEVESYFAGLGLTVPERINPPDFYMDALEGISSTAHVDPRTLPISWMMHKGYQIPTDMMASAVNDTDTTHTRFGVTFAQEAWLELYHKLVVTWDGIRTALSRAEDLSGRRTPGFFTQFRIILERVGKQRFREARLHLQDYIILLIAGACLGVLSNMKDTDLGSQGYHFTVIALALLTMIASLRTFSADKLQFWRESASGVNRIAFFMAKDMADLFNVVLRPVVYLSMFYFFSNPRSTLVDNYVITLVLVYCVTGLAYIFAILVEPAPAQLCAVFVPVIATLIVSSKRSGVLQILSYFSYARYALEAYILANAERYKGVWVIARCGLLANQGYRLDDFNFCLWVLVGHGLAARVVALLCLIFSHRSRQK